MKALRLAFALALVVVVGRAQVLYQTQFEPSEGFDPQFTLIGQRGWDGEGTGGNGLISGMLEEMGQHAYIGFWPPTTAATFTSAWHPVYHRPNTARMEVVRFNVAMMIRPSQNQGRDSFRWSVYNTNAVRLFSLDFAQERDPIQPSVVRNRINSILDDNAFAPTGFDFVLDGFYDLEIWMDFRRNVWSARMNDLVVVNGARMTTKGTPLHLGDIDAVWVVDNPTVPGDNFMVFDNYRVTVEALNSIPAALEMVGYDKTGRKPDFLIHGTPGLKYSVEVTDDFQQWYSLGDFTAPTGGSFRFEDTTASDFDSGFYRVRQVD